MNKKRVWLFVIPIILFFNLFILLGHLNEQNILGHSFLRNHVYRVGQHISGAFTDLKFLYRGKQKPKNKIIIVEIDDESLSILGRWPWSRDLTALLVNSIMSYSPKVLGLDIFFSEKEDVLPSQLKEILIQNKLGFLIDEFETDPKLARVIEKYQEKVVLGWGSDSLCSPLYSGELNCTQEDIQAIGSELEQFEKFKLKKIIGKKYIQDNHTAFLSLLSLNQNIEELQDAALHSGGLNAPKDSDGVIRKSPLFFLADGNVYPSLALEMAKIGLNQEVEIKFSDNKKLESLSFIPSKKNISVPYHGRMEVNFRGPADTFTYISAYELLGDAIDIRLWPGRVYPNSKVPFECHTCAMQENEAGQKYLTASKEEVLKDAYVLLGISALGANDIRSYPFDRHVPGVEGHANILDNILSGDSLISFTHGYKSIFIYGLSIFLALMLTVFWLPLGSVSSVLFLVLVLVVLFIVDFIILFSRQINIDSVWIYFEYIFIFLVLFIMKYIDEEKDKKFLKGAFSKYVAPAVVDAIVSDPTKLSLGGDKKELTILFSDIRSFTTLSEKMDAKVLAQFLNDYLGKMTGIVFGHKGTLDKYIGDALMAFWGAPIDVEDHAYQTCMAALWMQNKILEDKAFYQDKYGIEVKVGVGFHTGVVNVGNMGSKDNFNYTVIGDDVNLASRLEGLTKEYGVEILTSRASLEQISKSGHPLPLHRVLDFVKVKGKNRPVEIVEICVKKYSEEFLSLFSASRDLYLNRNWDDSMSKFRQAQSLFQKEMLGLDPVIERYLEVCEILKKTPPSADWDGSWQMTSK